MIEGILAVAVLAGLILNAWAGRRWADPAAAFVIVLYAGREGRHALLEANRLQPKFRVDLVEMRPADVYRPHALYLTTHMQTCANSSDQLRALTLTESHSLHRIS